jgi:ribosomal protein S18 acetylase RimI-like enzyme
MEGSRKSVDRREDGSGTMPGSEPVPLDATQQGQAGRVLARAFHHDPTYRFVLPEEDKRGKVLAWLFDRVVGYSLLWGEVHTTAALEGVACWLPPGETHLTFGRLVRSGLYATPLKMGLAAYRRFETYMSYANEFHKRCAPPSHWYLWAIGVDPSSQGRGIGSKLLERGLARASEDGTACYLETGVERNVRFYEKHGFKVVAEGTVPTQGLPVWAMLHLF